MEDFAYSQPDWNEIEREIVRFGHTYNTEQNLKQHYADWLAEAKKHIENSKAERKAKEAA
jgi:hypothetical protein